MIRKIKLCNQCCVGPFHYGVTLPQMADKAKHFRMWRLNTTYVFDRQTRASPAAGGWAELKNLSPQNPAGYEMLKQQAKKLHFYKRMYEVCDVIITVFIVNTYSSISCIIQCHLWWALEIKD